MKTIGVLILSLLLVGCGKSPAAIFRDNEKVETLEEVVKTVGTDETEVMSSNPSSEYDVVLTGDLTLFAGSFSTDEFNQIIVDSNFTYGGYTPDDYYSERTSVFPSIAENGYWNGIASHGFFEIKSEDLPQKVENYYKITVHGVNAGSNNQVLSFYLVPPHVEGPNGLVSDERTVFQIYDTGIKELFYQKDNWWEHYQKTATLDLDIQAINSGDFSSLVGTWVDGRGNELTIYQDGSTSFGDRLVAVPNSEVTSKIPYVSLRGAALGLFPIGFENPEGDQSDTSRPRLVITQTAGDYTPDFYYYRK